MAWTEDTLNKAETKLWELAEEYFDAERGSDARERIDQEFHLAVHCLVLEAWKAHVVGWSPTRMGIDAEVLEGLKEEG